MICSGPSEIASNVKTPLYPSTAPEMFHIQQTMCDHRVPEISNADPLIQWTQLSVQWMSRLHQKVSHRVTEIPGCVVLVPVFAV